MKKSCFVLLFVAMFALIACNYNDSQVSVNTADENQNVIVNGEVSLSRALTNADFVFKNTEALDYKKRQVKSVDILTRANTRVCTFGSRSSQNDQEKPIAYVVNYENNDGFAILAADIHLPPVIGIGDEGNFNTDEFMAFIQNGGATRSSANNDLNPAQAVQYAIVNNSLLLPPKDFGDVTILGSDTTVMLKCLPLVPTKWGQRDPYNYYAPPVENSDSVKKLAGCVPVAGAQVLASLCYHHNLRPTTQLSEEYPIDWNVINRIIYEDTYKFVYGNRSAEALAVASLIRAVGEDINANYGSSITTANTFNLENTFRSLGISNPKHGNASYNPPITNNDIFNMIVAYNYPVIAQATNSITGGDTHCFVLDGLLRLEYSLLFTNSEEIAPDIRSNLDNFQYNFDLVHINLGWNGQCDGYYLPDAFNLTEDKYREYAEEHDIDTSSSYVFDMLVVYLIYGM